MNFCFAPQDNGRGKLQLLLLDNMAAHYWVDRARHATPGQRPACAAMTLHAVHAAIAGKLQQVLAPAEFNAAQTFALRGGNSLAHCGASASM